MSFNYSFQKKEDIQHLKVAVKNLIPNDEEFKAEDPISISNLTNVITNKLKGKIGGTPPSPLPSTPQDTIEDLNTIALIDNTELTALANSVRHCVTSSQGKEYTEPLSFVKMISVLNNCNYAEVTYEFQLVNYNPRHGSGLIYSNLQMYPEGIEEIDKGNYNIARYTYSSPPQQDYKTRDNTINGINFKFSNIEFTRVQVPSKMAYNPFIDQYCVSGSLTINWHKKRSVSTSQNFVLDFHNIIQVTEQYDTSKVIFTIPPDFQNVSVTGNYNESKDLKDYPVEDYLTNSILCDSSLKLDVDPAQEKYPADDATYPNKFRRYLARAFLYADEKDENDSVMLEMEKWIPLPEDGTDLNEDSYTSGATRTFTDKEFTSTANGVTYKTSFSNLTLSLSISKDRNYDAGTIDGPTISIDLTGKVIRDRYRKAKVELVLLKYANSADYSEGRYVSVKSETFTF